MIAAQETFAMISDQDRERAEKRFKQEDRARDGKKAMAEYEIQGRAIRAKTERLRALRLAKEAQTPAEKPPTKPAARRPASRVRSRS
jgi:hypothetical protein